MSDKVVNRIKDFLQKGSWRDLKGVRRQIEKGTVSFQELLVNDTFSEQLMHNMHFEEGDWGFLQEQAKQEGLSIEQLRQYLAPHMYTKVAQELLRSQFDEWKAAIEAGDTSLSQLLSDGKLDAAFMKSLAPSADDMAFIEERITAETETIPLTQLQQIVPASTFQKTKQQITAQKLQFWKQQLQYGESTLHTILQSGGLDANFLNGHQLSSDDLRLFAFYAVQEQIEPEQVLMVFNSQRADMEYHLSSSYLQAINDNQIGEYKLRDLLNSGFLSENQIVVNTDLSKVNIKEILGEPVDSLRAPVLPPDLTETIQQDFLVNRTDVFTLGVPGSGKSLFLGALFYYVSKEGKLGRDKIYPAATKYVDFLLDAVDKGMPVEGTDINCVIHLPVSFRGEVANRGGLFGLGGRAAQRSHPFNFIEMAGEGFQGVYKQMEDTSYENNGEVAIFLNYLRNSKNKRIFFFAIDYERYQSGKESRVEATQEAQFQNMLTFVEQQGFIKDTIAICFLITKWDKCPDPSPEAAKAFLKDRYNSLYNEARRLERQNKDLHLKVFTFSIGEVTRVNTYKYDPHYCRGIFNWLQDTSYYEWI